MMTRPFLMRCAAVLLILVFSQKTGTGLFIHSLLHTGKTAGKFPVKQTDKDKHLGFACTCIDDFLMPCTEGKEPGMVHPDMNFVIAFVFFKVRISYRTPVYAAFRGPPAFFA